MGKQKEYLGTVISDKMQKTIIVRIMRLAKHVKYGRIIKRYNKFKAHDENGIAKIGDEVRIRETRPLSKDKRFRLIEVVKKAPSVNIEFPDTDDQVSRIGIPTASKKQDIGKRNRT